ncbi:actin-related protein 2/3 complex subunit 2B [Tanacetum coccineum]
MESRNGCLSLSLEFNGIVSRMLSLYMRCSTEESRCYGYTLDGQGIGVDDARYESRCYRYTLDVQRMSRDAIVVHEMFNGGVEMLSLYIRVEMLSLYMRCSTDESSRPCLVDEVAFLIPSSKGCSVVSVVSRIFLAATTYYIWQEHHSRLFRKKSWTSYDSEAYHAYLCISTPLLSTGSSISNALPYKIKETVKRICPQVIEIAEPPKEGYQLTLELDFSKAFFQELVDVGSWGVRANAAPCYWLPFSPPELRGEPLSDLSTNEGHRMGAVAACALPWLRSLPLQHASFIMSEEASLIALNSLYQMRCAACPVYG